MIAYDKKSIEALAIRKHAVGWFKLNLIDEVTKINIFNAHQTKFKTTTLFSKIGVFIFTLLAAIFASGSLSGLVGLGGSEIGAGIMILIFGGVGTFLLENMIKSKNLYRSGIDNALVYFSSWSILVGIALIINNGPEQLGLTYFFACIIFTGYSIRYSDVLTTILAYVSLLFFIYVLLSNLSFSIIPFSFMILSAIIYVITKRKLSDNKLKYWTSCIQTLRILSLLSFYMAGKYYVIRTMTVEMLHFYHEEGKDIPIAIVFFIFTAIIPLLYIYYALKTKDRLILLTGIIITVFSALTFKARFSVGHPEILLTLVGALVIFIAYISIKYLKTPKHGFTNDADQNFEELEALAIVQTFKPSHAANDSKIEMGGGKFGGGGAGSEF